MTVEDVEPIDPCRRGSSMAKELVQSFEEQLLVAKCGTMMLFVLADGY